MKIVSIVRVGRQVARNRLSGVLLLVVATLGFLVAPSGAAVKTTTTSVSVHQSVRTVSASSCTSQAQALVRAAKRPMSPNIPKTSFSMKGNAGKTVWWISPGQSIPFAASISQGFAAAAKAAGVKAVIFDGQLSVVKWSQGVSEAVAAHASGIVLQAINPADLSGPLAAAKKAGIPVIDSFNGNPNSPLGSLYAHVTTNFNQQGKEMAAYELALTKCKTQMGVFSESIYPIYAAMNGGIKSELSKLCPTCSAQFIDVNGNTIATSEGQQLSTLLSRSPGTNALIADADENALYMVPVLKSAGKKIPLIGHDGIAASFNWIRQGTTSQVATVSDCPLPAIGWAQMDEIGRAMLKLPAANDTVPTQLVDKSNVGRSNAVGVMFPGFNNINAQYLKVWSVG